MAKQNYFLDHLRNPNNRDLSSPLLLNADTNRLALRYKEYPGDWSTIANYIHGPNGWPVMWYPDANIAFLNQTTPIWDALRLAALGTSQGKTVISEVAEAEMTEWLNKPYHNEDRATAIKAAIDGGTWISTFRLEETHPLRSSIYNHTLLLGSRRLLARPRADGTTLVNTNATDKTATMNAIRNQLGPRAQGLAKKGRIDADTRGVISIADEMHCILAILYALQNRRDTVILTADQDFIEIFYKAQWFFDTHYRAWLVGKLINGGRYGVPVKEMHETKGYFEGPLTLYKRPTLQMLEVLPLDSRSVKVGLLYVAPNGRLHRLCFPFELNMLEMLETRAVCGRCTNLFGESNLHIDLGPLKREVDGLYLGIGKDSTIDFETNGVRSSLSRLDLEHSVCCFERLA